MTTSVPTADAFTALLTTFADAVQSNHGQCLAMLFTEDGVYEDGFFGAHTGRAAIAAMLQRFHDTGSSYLWEFVDPAAMAPSAMPAFASATPRYCPKARGVLSCSRASAASGFAAS
jgi:hypothetical protein